VEAKTTTIAHSAAQIEVEVECPSTVCVTATILPMKIRLVLASTQVLSTLKAKL